MKPGRQQTEGGRRKRLWRGAWLGLRVLSFGPMVTWSQTTNDIPPLRPPHAEIPPTFWEQHVAGVSLLGFIFVALLGIVIWLATRPRPPVVVPPEVLVRGELESLRPLPEDGRVLSKVSQAVRRYFGVAFALPPGELTTTEFCQAMAANDLVGSELSTATGDFLRRCDERKFAPDAAIPAAGAAEQALALVAQAEAHREQTRRAAPVNVETRAKR